MNPKSRFLPTPLLVLPLLLANFARAQQTSERLIAEEHFRRAEPLVRAVLARQPFNIDALIDLSTIEWSYGNLDQAQTDAEKAVAAADGSAAAHAQLVNILGAKLASRRTGTMEKMGLSRRFRREAERTLLLDPNNVYALEALARYCWYAPMISGGDKAKAMERVKQVMAIDSTRGYALKAELDATQDKSRALEDWRDAVAAQPGSYAAHVGLGNALLSAGGESWKNAEAEGERAAAIEATRIAAYRLLATVYATTQQWQRLDATLRQARVEVPDDAGADFAAAQAILEHKIASQYARADEYLRRYLARPPEGLEPSTAMAHWQLGLVLEEEGRRSMALLEVQMAANLDPTLDGAKHDAKRLQELQ